MVNPGYKSFRKIPHLWYGEHTTNVCFRDLVNSYNGHQEPLLSILKRLKLAWFGNVTYHDTLSKVILQETEEGRNNSRTITLKSGQGVAEH